MLTEKILNKLTTIEILLKELNDNTQRQSSKPLSFKEACSYLGYAPSYLYKLTYKNLIPHYKPTGKMIFFSKNELDEWIFKGSDEYRVKSDELEEEKKTEKDLNQIEMALETEDEKRMSDNKDSSAGSTPLSTGTRGMTKESDASTIHSLSSGQGSAQELLIEFPLKSRRKK